MILVKSFAFTASGNFFLGGQHALHVTKLTVQMIGVGKLEILKGEAE